MPRHPCSLKIIQGMRGRGKTNSVKWEYNNDEPLFIVDIRNEYNHIPKFTNHAQFLMWAACGAKPNQFGKYQFRFNFSTKADYIGVFKSLCHIQNSTIIVDEADALFQDKKFSQPLIDMFLGSRNNKLHLVYNIKRPFLIPIMIRSQADEWTVFTTEEERDVHYLERRLRTQLPKDPFKLDIGECLILKAGQKPKIKHFPLFTQQQLSLA